VVCSSSGGPTMRRQCLRIGWAYEPGDGVAQPSAIGMAHLRERMVCHRYGYCVIDIA